MTDDDEKFAQVEIYQMSKKGRKRFVLYSTSTVTYSEAMLQLIFKKMLEQRINNIDTIILDDMEITDETVKVLCQLPWLNYISLSCNKLTNVSVVEIVTRFPDLERLCLAENKEISDISLCKTLKKLKQLWMDGTSVCLTADDIENWIVKSQLETVNFCQTPTRIEEIQLLCTLWGQDLPNQDFLEPTTKVVKDDS